MRHLEIPSDPKERLEFLEAMADSTEETNYYKVLTADEILARKSDFTANALKVDDLEAEKKETMDDFKERMKPLKESHHRLSEEIRRGTSETFGRLYKFVDHQTKMVRYYNVLGESIETKTRPANTEELRQLTIAHSRRAVNE